MPLQYKEIFFQADSIQSSLSVKLDWIIRSVLCHIVIWRYLYDIFD